VARECRDHGQVGRLERVDRVRGLDRTGADPGALIVEITEMATVGQIHHARAFARDLQILGCRLAIDDFGAGFGSFAYLKHLPFDFLKIDGDFVTNARSSRPTRSSSARCATSPTAWTVGSSPSSAPTRRRSPTSGRRASTTRRASASGGPRPPRSCSR